MAEKSFVPVKKIGVIGPGRFGRLHSLTLAGLAEAELVSVMARRQESLDKIAPELPGVLGWTNLEQAIDESDALAGNMFLSWVGRGLIGRGSRGTGSACLAQATKSLTGLRWNSRGSRPTPFSSTW